MPGAVLDPFRERAAALIDQPDDLRPVLAEAEQRAEHSAALRELVPGLCRLVAAAAAGEYDDAEDDEVQLALAALLYVVSPWDETPDYLPHGLRDDEVVARSVVNELERALREFEAWRVPHARRPRRKV